MNPKSANIPSMLENISNRLDNVSLSLSRVGGALEVVIPGTAEVGDVFVVDDVPDFVDVRRVLLLCFSNSSTESAVDLNLYHKVVEDDEEFWFFFGSKEIKVSPDLNSPDQMGLVSGISQLVHGGMFAEGLGLTVTLKSPITDGFSVKGFLYQAD